MKKKIIYNRGYLSTHRVAMCPLPSVEIQIKQPGYDGLECLTVHVVKKLEYDFRGEITRFSTTFADYVRNDQNEVD